ncbi:transcription repressor OFP13-like [Hordeum vulgare subsp. vulgare]|uniref:Transcription repressor n=1 Tax=Hordeum vulgare subsp. vulgare TaxID=112509 RepID=A0A8I6XVW8_HORVV|nr:transcription repressor OFP13-like [Hordeum vulgare subsp. vulgare]
MGKKGALASIFSRSSSLACDSSTAAVIPSPWPSCRDPQTDSFHAGEEPCATAAGGSRCGPVAARHRKLVGAPGEMYKTVNSVYIDPDDGESFSCLSAEGEETVVVENDGFSTSTVSEEWSEAVIRSLSRTTSSTGRFFFDQGPATHSIPFPSASAASTTGSTPPEEENDKSAALSKNEKPGDGGKSLVVEESVAVPVDSADPYGDFLSSMDEMVAAHELRGWDALEELLVWYLRVNTKNHHPLIVRAFVDLLTGLTASATANTSTTTRTMTSSSSTSSTSSTSTSSSTSMSTITTGGDGVVVSAASATGLCDGGNGASASCSSSSSCLPGDDDEASRGED